MVLVRALVGGDEYADEGENDAGGDHDMAGLGQSLADCAVGVLIDKPDARHQVG